MSILPVLLITFLPLLGSIIAFLSKDNNKFAGQIFPSLLVAVSAILSWYLFFISGENSYTIHIASLLSVGSFQADWSLYVDSLTSLMFIVVATVSAVVHFYSIGYMHGDGRIAKFFSYISLFTFCMMMLVSSNNLIQLFFGWEGVGLCSYLLIGFWFKKESANNAAMKAFIVNRVGDFGLALGIALIYYLFNSVNFADIFAHADIYKNHFTLGFPTLTVITFLLFIGCMGKSAQIGLHTWLPDAMEGPTPVSALIHAATMVTAGVFLLARCSPLFELTGFTREFIVIIGSITCFVGATIALVQQDVKKIIAYSTCSQLGYMFIACGMSYYNFAMFHLATHAFFKALLFLCAGNVIHALPNGNQKINDMPAGLWKKLPITYALMWIGSLALIGIFPFSGFYSKDLILLSAKDNNFAFFIAVMVVSLTAFYSIRLILTVFHRQESIVSDKLKPREGCLFMLIPLFFLAFLAIASGFGFEHFFKITADSFWHGSIALKALIKPLEVIGLFALYFAMIGCFSAFFLRKVLLKKENISIDNIFDFWIFIFIAISLQGLVSVPYSSVVTGVISALSLVIIISILFLGKSGSKKFYYDIYNGSHRLLSAKYYFDEIYNAIFVKVIRNYSMKLWEYIDVKLIDNFGVNGLVFASQRLALSVVNLQTGFVFDYTLSILVSIVIIIGMFICLF
ncbi:MAG: NADH-quinone oxidoreductase subunit L [Rickettsiaceae bacterium H1]|nr:NADH-quinone oxidoreductase subunit L [Rickettsiaceae bacterium H1]